MSNRRNRRVDPVSTLLSGLLLLFAGVYFGSGQVAEANEDQRIVAEGVRAVGTITDVEVKIAHRKRGAGEGSRKLMDVSYADNYGRDYSLTYREPYRARKEGSKEAVTKRLLGTEVAVFYHPWYPSKAVVEGDADSVAWAYVWSIGMGLFGFFFAASGAWELKQRRASSKPKDAARTKDAASGTPTPVKP